MTTIYILVKERYAFGPNKSYIMDVRKDWDKICSIREKLIQTAMEKGDPWFDEIKHDYNISISELELIKYNDYIHYVCAKNVASVGIEFRIVEQEIED